VPAFHLDAQTRESRRWNGGGGLSLWKDEIL